MTTRRPMDVEMLLQSRGLSREKLAPALVERMQNDRARLDQALGNLGFTEDEADDIVREIIESYGAAMRAVAGIRRLCN